MAVYRLGDLVPTIDPTAFVHPQAVIIGNVEIGPESSIWAGTVLRGDFGRIVIGARTSVQDGSVLHAGPDLPTKVGDDCVIGHLVHMEGCRVEDGALIGSGSVVLHLAVIGEGATVAASALVTARTRVPPGGLAVGVPAVVRQDASRPEDIQVAVEEYVGNARRFREDLERID